MYNDNMTFIYNYCNISFCKKILKILKKLKLF